LPAGSNIVLSQWVTQRDPRWFAEPERFNPDRWSDETAAKLPRFAYFPFGGGRAVCIGAGFAMMEAILLLATIAQRYRIACAPSACRTIGQHHAASQEGDSRKARRAARAPVSSDRPSGAKVQVRLKSKMIFFR